MRSMSFVSALLLVSALAGCASLHRAPPAPDARARFDDAVARYDYGDLAGTMRELAWIRRSCAGHALGRQATLTLAALRLDARNPDSQADSAAALAAAYLQSAGLDDWKRPIAATLYLTALDLGAGTQDTPSSPAPDSVGLRTSTPAARVSAPPSTAPVRNCGPVEPLPNATGVPNLPVLPGAPVVARLQALRLDRGQLAATVDSLRTALDSARQELVAKEKELERIRKTLKP